MAPPGSFRSANFGFTTTGRGREEEFGDISSERGGALQDSGRFYTDFHTEMGQYRSGGRKLAPEVQFHRTTSRKAHRSEAVEICRAEREEIMLGMHSDSALHVVDGSVAGHRALPTSREIYHSAMRHAKQTSQMQTRAGLSSRNWRRAECQSESWERETLSPYARSRPTVEGSLPVDTSSSSVLASRPGEEIEARFGAHGRGAACDTSEEVVG